MRSALSVSNIINFEYHFDTSPCCFQHAVFCCDLMMCRGCMSNNARSINNNERLYAPGAVQPKLVVHLVSAGAQNGKKFAGDPGHWPVSRMQNADVKLDFRLKPQGDNPLCHQSPPR